MANLLVHGAKDKLVSVEQVPSYHKELKEKQIPCELYELADAGEVACLAIKPPSNM